MFTELKEKLQYFTDKKAALDARHGELAKIAINTAQTLEKEARRIENRVLSYKQTGSPLCIQNLSEDIQTVIQQNPIPDNQAETEALEKEYADLHAELTQYYSNDLKAFDIEFQSIKDTLLGLCQSVGFKPTGTIPEQVELARRWVAFITGDVVRNLSR